MMIASHLTANKKDYRSEWKPNDYTTYLYNRPIKPKKIERVGWLSCVGYGGWQYKAYTLAVLLLLYALVSGNVDFWKEGEGGGKREALEFHRPKYH